MVSVGGYCIVKNRERCLELSIRSVLPFVDDFYVLIDDRSCNEIVDIVKSLGVRYSMYKWKDHFAMARNDACSRLYTDWHFGIDSDETFTVDRSKVNFKALIEEATIEGVDWIAVARHNWIDEGMTQEFHQFWPDYQRRIKRRRCAYVGRVHEVIDPKWRKSLYVPGDHMWLNHLGYYKSMESWQEIHDYYCRLAGMKS